jgi:NADPH2:quinone reductase
MQIIHSECSIPVEHSVKGERRIMCAVRFSEFGGPEVLELVQAGEPVPGPGQVTIEVAYAGVNFADLKARSDGYRVPALPFVPGIEASGRVRAVGPGVAGLEPGQAVAALVPSGAYAEVVLADAATVFPLPDGIDARTAATLPIVLPTAHALLHEVGQLRAGESVLVHGAAGGIGTVAGQLARAAGAARVYGVVSAPARRITPSPTATTRCSRPTTSPPTRYARPADAAST